MIVTEKLTQAIAISWYWQVAVLEFLKANTRFQCFVYFNWRAGKQNLGRPESWPKKGQQGPNNVDNISTGSEMSFSFPFQAWTLTQLKYKENAK